MQIDQAAEWQRLTKLYREMWDNELLNLADDFSALTEMAQQVLRDELKLRGLGEARPREAPERSVRPPIPQHDFDEDLSMAEDANSESNPRNEFTWKTLLCECDTREEAWQVYELLRRAGLESWIEAPASRSIELSSPRVLVAADELDRAREIAAQPIPQDIIDESRMKLPEFELPRCPRCGAEDPVLESVDPCNSWTCESCGNEWTESVE
ncbi:MAG: hypothetical protein WBE76_20560 [Terracidiphilus sp.]